MRITIKQLHKLIVEAMSSKQMFVIDGPMLAVKPPRKNQNIPPIHTHYDPERGIGHEIPEMTPVTVLILDHPSGYSKVELPDGRVVWIPRYNLVDE